MNTDSYLRMTFRKLAMMAMALCVGVSFAGITVSDVEVFSAYPWKEVVVGYTITGADAEADVVRLTATDKTADKSYTVETGATALTGAKLSYGRHLLRWQAAADGVRFSSTNVVFTVSVVSGDAVQLWENGPYWAKCNVGAKKPEEFGYYFWWGDTIGYQRNIADNGWISVKDGSGYSFDYETDVCPTSGKAEWQLLAEGYVDLTDNLVSAHDAATAHLGVPWRMPRRAELEGLIANCDATWTTRGGVYGYLVTGRGPYASKSIFLPVAGCGYYSGLWNVGCESSYWSSMTLPTSHPGRRWILKATHYDNSGTFHLDHDGSYYGNSVRPVRDPSM